MIFIWKAISLPYKERQAFTVRTHWTYTELIMFSYLGPSMLAISIVLGNSQLVERYAAASYLLNLTTMLAQERGREVFITVPVARHGNETCAYHCHVSNRSTLLP